MNCETSSNLDLLEQQLAVMRSLATSLEQSQKFILTLDSPQLERHVAQQQDLCRQWRELQGVAVSTPRSGAYLPAPIAHETPGTTVPSSERRSALVQEVSQVERQIRHLNRVHAALLKYMHRSMTVLANLLSVSDHTYARPKLDHHPAPARSGKE